MSALPLAPVSAPPRTRPRLRLVGPGYVPDPPLRSHDGEHTEDQHAPLPHTGVEQPGSRARQRVAQSSSGRSAVAAPAVRRHPSSAPMRLTARGRLAVGIATVVAGLVAAVGLGSAVGTLLNPGTEASGLTVVVDHGESLWTVAAAAAAPGEDVRDVAAQIAQLNGLRGGVVTAGQVLQLPSAP